MSLEKRIETLKIIADTKLEELERLRADYYLVKNTELELRIEIAVLKVLLGRTSLSIDFLMKRIVQELKVDPISFVLAMDRLIKNDEISLAGLIFEYSPPVGSSFHVYIKLNYPKP